MSDPTVKRPTPRTITTDQIRAMTANAQHRVLPPKAPEEMSGMSVIQLDVGDVLFYEKNPRKHINSKYDEIMASIRVRGLESELFVTKRPGAAQYVLARGGKTRLLILQALRKEDPKKWAKHEFREIPYVSESHILAAHIVENTSRSEMCFYDTAQSILEMRDQLVAELGKDISQRELATQLTDRGIEVSRDDIYNAVFVVEFLEELGAWKDQLILRHVHLTIRPGIKQLQVIWLLWPDHTTQSFKQLVDQGVAKAVASVPEYSADSLVAAVTQAVATALDISPSALSMALASHRETAIKSVQEFEARLLTPAAPASPAPQYQTTHDGDGDDASNHATTQPVGAWQAPVNAGARTATDVPGIAGVSVVTGLQQRSTPVAAKPTYAPRPKNDGPLTEDEMQALANETPVSLAQSAFWSDLMAFADTAGIGALVTRSPCALLPYGFYVEMPKPGALGESIADIAVQAWWLLLGLSTQADQVQALLDAPDGFVDTGPDCFKQVVLAGEEAMSAAVKHRLGQEVQPRFDVVVGIVTNTQHPLHDALLTLLFACKGLNDARGAA